MTGHGTVTESARRARRHAQVVCLASVLAVALVACATSTPGPPQVPRTPAPTSTSVATPSPTASPAATATARLTPRPPSTGAWRVNAIARDPLTDAEMASAFLEAASGTSEYGESPLLFIGCRDGDTDLAIDWQQFVDSDSHVVSVRVGSGAVQTEDWTEGSDGSATFYPSYLGVEGFIVSMFGQTELIARTTPYLSIPITAEFRIAGIESAVVNVRQLCGW